MTVYIDKDYKCYASPASDRREIKTDAFDGKCPEYIEGYRFVPAGEVWVREDGVEFVGEMIAPWKPYTELDAAQREHEKQLLTEYAAALNVMGVQV